MSDVLHVWLGRFGSERAVEAFFEETYADEEDEGGDEDAPISAFAESQGCTFYDHDWLETHFDREGVPLREFLLDRLPQRHVATTVEALARARGIEGADTLVLFVEAWSGEPRSRAADPALWYLGDLSEAELKSLRPPIDEASRDLSPAEWTDLPRNGAELSALKRRFEAGEGRLAAAAKLALVHLDGTLVERDEAAAGAYLAELGPYPELLHACLEANAEAGSAEAWLQLFHLHERRFEGAVTDDVRSAFLDRAVAAGSTEAKVVLAARLMYDWLEPRRETDYRRAETLLLEAHAEGASTDYELHCIYASERRETHDPREAFRWLSIHADRTGIGNSFSRLARLYVKGEGVERDAALACKCLYLSMCQDGRRNVRADQAELLDAASVADIESGRRLARRWIEDRGGEAERFEGVRREPFETYLAGGG